MDEDSKTAPTSATPSRAGDRDRVLGVLIQMDDIRRRDASEYEAHADRGRGLFCDGGASRMSWAIEELRVALRLPCEWREAAEAELNEEPQP